jgi:hypothetical protein
MVGLQVMKKGKWVNVSSLSEIRRGNAYRLKTGSDSWSEPRLATSHARRSPHPDNRKIIVWAVDGLYETVRR